jgi:FRG domain
MQEIEVKRWSDFETQVQSLSRLLEEREAKTYRRFYAPLFRGLANSKRGLETTLERSYPGERCDATMSLLKYYRKVLASRPAVETLTGKTWDKVPDFLGFKRLLKNDGNGWLDEFFNKHPAIYEYLIYLRHHRYPSPLLDWTASPYVAAFFAFDIVAENVDSVCVYALLLDTGHSGSSDAHLFIIGPHVRSHRRHYAQQSYYSMCVKNDGEDYQFLQHEQAMADALGSNGDLFKFKLPASERLSVLKHLDLMNVNPYSLYGSEDSLIQTIARRECLFRNWDL